MAITQVEKRKWLEMLRETRFVLDALRHQTCQAVRPNTFTPSTQKSLWQVPPGRLVRKFDSETATETATLGPELASALSSAVDEVRSFLDSPQPWTTMQVAQDLTRAVPVIDASIDAVEGVKVNDEKPSDVVDELERDYLLSLAVTLTGQGTITQKLFEWEGGNKGDYLDIATFRLVRDGGPGRVHMRDVHEATDAGMTTFLFGKGFSSFDKDPQVQRMLYSQWFTYMYAVWEEQYRLRLANAHGADADGEPWTRFDISHQLFGDIRNIRNDVVHKNGVVDASADNSLLTWFGAGKRLEIQAERMLSLVTMFPREDLLATPTRAQPGNPQNLPWPVAPELVDEIRQLADQTGLTRKQKKDIGNEALRLWIAARKPVT
ncbi:hypothetical protein [Mycolicibacterium aubagnense]|uniref:PH domain-containing protein n=1 Tax=Mycolicibacterium aubagnense TaxID=319707 RepID=A0ABN5YYI1_9MYCO|nr:hypothetical protein [Mycolicibacterium aubagnense]TLH58178.1 hypothetical protein C1S80_21220 [Mycolicibacterium aubagnense]WGI31596.1 hypothetical protein QDT91_20530 [Mycolicibacterium aubagnense]BBX86945.1 hypothetical protein MAUB_48180 [Mycolicibacterium aubagnense]